MKLDFSSTKILVLGDVMLDSYWHGSTSRISPEAPVPIVHITEFEERAGGAANVALNISSLDSEVYLLGIVGTDKQAQSLETNLVAASINCNFHKIAAMKTINKVRVLSQHQQLIRIDFENYFNGVDVSPLIQSFQEQLPLIDVVILSDYGKGTLYQIEKFISFARAANKPILIDPKGRDFSKYSGASLITPNLSEFEAVVGKCNNNESEIAEKAEKLRINLNLEAILVTRGEHGMSLICKNNPPFHLPTHAREVFDVTGAGDTVIATLAASLGAGKDMKEATQIANLAAGIVVGKLGSATTNITELYQAWDRNK